MLEGLKYVHSYGVVHDDIKLENVLLQSSNREDEYGRAKLCDFGLAHLIDPSIGKAHYQVKAGTPGYMAPELSQVTYFCLLTLQSQVLGTEADMWSFGVVLYELSVAYKPTQVQNYRYGKFK